MGETVGDKRDSECGRDNKYNRISACKKIDVGISECDCDGVGEYEMDSVWERQWESKKDSECEREKRR